MPSVALTPAEEDALVRFRPGDGGAHVESLFCKVVLPGRRALWLGLTFLQRTIGRRDAVVEAFAVAFGPRYAGPVAVRKVWPWAEARVEEGCLYVRLPDLELRQGGTRGELVDEDTGARVAWDLTFTTEPEGFRHVPADWLLRSPLVVSKAVSPQIDCRFDGTVTVGDEVLPAEGTPGMLGHRWGRARVEAWSWAHCNAWKGADGVTVEAVTGRVRLGPLPAPALTSLHVRYPGERLTFNGLRQLVFTRSERDGLVWTLDGRRGDRRVEATFKAPADRFAGLDQVDPDGRVVHTLLCGAADAELRVLHRDGDGWRPVLETRSDGAAGLELGSRDETWGVKIHLR